MEMRVIHQFPELAVMNVKEIDSLVTGGYKDDPWSSEDMNTSHSNIRQKWS